MIDYIHHHQQTEIEEIKERSIADNSFMKAPNGSDSKLTEKQWLQVRTKAFKKWFGDWELDGKEETSPNTSKVVDENGEPMVMYHGTPRGGFTEFGGDSVFYKKLDFWYFTRDKGYVNTFVANELDNASPQVYEVFINARSIYDAKLVEEMDWALYTPSGAFRSNLIEDSYDSMQENNFGQIVVFSPNQIKSAIDNNIAFSLDNNDIRFRFIGEKGAKNLDKAEEATHPLHNIEQAIDEISKILGIVVEKVKSRELLPLHLQKRMNNKGRYPGMYYPKTDKVYVILNEILNENDAKATILHEALGHKGLRVLKGKGFEKFLDDVCESMPSNKREEYLKRFDNNKLLATEEYLAEFAEGYKNPSTWEKVKAIFNNFLRSVGINIKISDGDLMYTFKKAKNKLTPSYSKEKKSKAVTITPTKTTTGKDLFFAKFGVIFNLETYNKMVKPLIKANAGAWSKTHKAVLFSKLTSAISFKNSLSAKIHNKEIPVLSWKKEQINPSPTTKSHKI